MDPISLHNIKKNNCYIMKEIHKKNIYLYISHINQYLGGDFVFFYDDLDDKGNVLSLHNTVYIPKGSPIEFYLMRK